MLRPFLLLATLFDFADVVLRAFAAHGLKKQLSTEYLVIFQIGVHYQLIHTLTLFGVALLATRLDGRPVSATGGLFILDILLFSGSFYLLTPSGIGKFGIVAPFGGISFLAGWLYLGLAAQCLGNT